MSPVELSIIIDKEYYQFWTSLVDNTLHHGNEDGATVYFAILCSV